MSKTFTCRELGGICDEKITGETFAEILEKGMAHMQADPAHMTQIMGLSETTGESKDEWMARLEKAFDERAHNVRA